MVTVQKLVDFYSLVQKTISRFVAGRSRFVALEPRAARDFELRSMSKEGMFEKKLKWLETDRPTNGRKIKIKLHILFMIINIMKLTFTSFCPNYTSDMVSFFNHRRLP